MIMGENFLSLLVLCFSLDINFSQFTHFCHILISLNIIYLSIYLSIYLFIALYVENVKVCMYVCMYVWTNLSINYYFYID